MSINIDIYIYSIQSRKQHTMTYP